MAVFEIAISTVNRADSQGSALRRIKEGDIVVVRNPIGVVGSKEVNEFLWFTIETTPEVADSLTEPGVDGDKRNFKIQLPELKSKVLQSLDLVKARDKSRVYQPFVFADPDRFTDGRFMPNLTPVQLGVVGLVERKNVR